MNSDSEDEEILSDIELTAEDFARSRAKKSIESGLEDISKADENQSYFPGKNNKNDPDPSWFLPSKSCYFIVFFISGNSIFTKTVQSSFFGPDKTTSRIR